MSDEPDKQAPYALIYDRHFKGHLDHGGEFVINGPDGEPWIVLIPSSETLKLGADARARKRKSRSAKLSRDVRATPGG